MPFSRSRSPESMTRSTTAWLDAEGAGLAEHRVDEGGLAVVDVRDDGDIAEVGAGGEVRGLGLGVGHGGVLLLVGRDGRLSHGKCFRGSGAVVPRTLGVMTVAAVILAASADGAVVDTLGQPRVRRLADLAWSGGALPIVVAGT